jgi:hypothetical protein
MHNMDYAVVWIWSPRGLVEGTGITQSCVDYGTKASLLTIIHLGSVGLHTTSVSSPLSQYAPRLLH